MEKFIAYVLTRLDDPTAWIGIIGLLLMLFGFHSALGMLFVILLVFPETQFNSFFKEWAQKLRDLNK